MARGQARAAIATQAIAALSDYYGVTEPRLRFFTQKNGTFGGMYYAPDALRNVPQADTVSTIRMPTIEFYAIGRQVQWLYTVIHEFAHHLNASRGDAKGHGPMFAVANAVAIVAAKDLGFDPAYPTA